MGEARKDSLGKTDKHWYLSGATFKICDISDRKGDGIKIIVP